MRAILAVLTLAATTFPALAAGKDVDFTWKAIGYVRVIDGDTIELKRPELAFCPPSEPCPDEAFETVGSIKVRLHGIDAPETDQVCYRSDGAPWMCGLAATAQLEALIGLDKVTCFGGGSGMDEADLYGLRIAACHVWPRSNLNADMVRFGFALAYREYSDSYVLYEGFAKTDKAGMWAGDFAAPWEWRRKKELRDLRDRIERGLKRVERNRI